MRGEPRALGRVLLWTVAYVAAGYLGRATIIDAQSLSLVWPAAGVAALWFATGSRRTWGWDAAALATATFVVNFSTGAPPALALTFVVTNLTQAALFCLLVRRLSPDLWGFGGRRVVSSLADLGALIAAAVAACLVGASLGHLGLRLVLGGGNLSTFTVWWGRNTAGILLVGTLGLLVLAPLAGSTDPADLRHRMRRTLLPPTAREGLEGLLITGVSLALYAGVFTVAGTHPLAFMLLFTVVLAAVRLGPLGVVLHGLATGSFAIGFTLAGLGPFAAIESVYSQALVAQVFVCMTVVTGLLLSFSRLERDTAMAALAASQRSADDRATLFGTILENMREGLVVVQDDGTVLMRNPAGRELLGMTGETSTELMPAEYYGLLDADGTPVREEDLPFQRALAGDEVVGEHYKLRGPTLTGERHLEVSATLLPGRVADDHGKVVLNFRDVTADRQDRDALASFAGVVAHDLFTPLTLVNGWADSLQEAFEDGAVAPEDGRPMLSRIQTAGRHMSSFIDDLLSYTLARDASVTLEPVDLTGIAEQVAVMRRQGDNRPRIVVQPGMRAAADPVLVRQLLDNLVGNAVKYVAPEVRPMVRISAERRGRWLEVTVRDNGIGVPEAQRTQIFEDFHRAHAADYRGTGIGLAICRRVVERHGGTLRVEDNTVGHGSAFVFTLPVTGATTQDRPLPAEAAGVGRAV